MLRLPSVVKWIVLCLLPCAVGLRAQGAGPLPAPTTLRAPTADGEVACAMDKRLIFGRIKHHLKPVRSAGALKTEHRLCIRLKTNTAVARCAYK